MKKVDDMIVKIGITPSNAPFKMACLRTFLYIGAIAEKNAYLGGNSKIVFQIDDTNLLGRKHSNEEILDFYRKMAIIPFVNSETIITSQTDLSNECELHFNKLDDDGLIIHNDDGTCSFDINEYIARYGNLIEVNDQLNGIISFNAKDLTSSGNVIIKRSDGTFLYNFCSAVDAVHWKFTTLIRGNNKLSSAAFQNMYIKALGYNPPDYFHLPLLLDEKKSNEYDINAKSDIRILFENGFSYMPVINYLLNTGYGDQTDIYLSIEDFNKRFDPDKLHRENSHFDFNILKKTCNRFYQQEMSYEEYYKQLITFIDLMDWPLGILDYSNVGYKYRLSPQKLFQLYTQLGANHLDELYDFNQKEQILVLVDSLMQDYEGTMSNLLLNKQHRKESLKLVKYILSGYFDGLSCDVYKSCYTEENYIKRLNYIKQKISKM